MKTTGSVQRPDKSPLVLVLPTSCVAGSVIVSGPIRCSLRHRLHPPLPFWRSMNNLPIHKQLGSIVLVFRVDI
uniref:Uncharacterized protein n=1 Tax=Arundo donax TaxID=35708 RepID=A0A0A8ZDD8_ARUDO